ncbi:MAG: hypothetical protein OER95_10995 [Acidimicrobiia bacterium]|nr:hypothetical protein [Acidimicrobiia bacterium]
MEATGVQTPTMLWDPSFTTWQAFGVQANSQMMVLSPDLETGSNLIYGFDDQQQADILEFATTGFES